MGNKQNCYFPFSQKFPCKIRKLVNKMRNAVALGAVHMSRASSANRADSILSRPMMA